MYNESAPGAPEFGLRVLTCHGPLPNLITHIPNVTQYLPNYSPTLNAGQGVTVKVTMQIIMNFKWEFEKTVITRPFSDSNTSQISHVSLLHTP